MNAERPSVIMPDEVAGLVRDTYAQADTILEYGAGGSTVMAAELPDKHVVSVESDRRWVRCMRRWFVANPPAEGTTVDVIWSDIGKTAEWGHPADDSDWRKFASYPLGVWQRRKVPHPDVVLVDGRFRIGCALATAFSIERPVTLLFDDYTRRKGFSQVEEFLGVPVMTGRMARFRVAPATVPANRLLQIIKFMSRP